MIDSPGTYFVNDPGRSFIFITKWTKTLGPSTYWKGEAVYCGEIAGNRERAIGTNSASSHAATLLTTTCIAAENCRNLYPELFI